MEEEVEKVEVLERNTKSGVDSHPGPTAGLPLLMDDLILEILSRLPARSVHRFKCVSLLWRDLIADPANRNKLPQTLARFLYFTTDDSGHRHHFASVSGGAAPFDPSLPNKYYKDMAQVDACNGLLLYRGSSNNKLANWNWAEEDFRFLVCNPVTGRWVELPPSPQVPENRYSCTAGLAFDPAVSSHFYVLQFEQIFLGSYITSVNIYSSRTGAWSHRDRGMVDKVTLCFFSKFVFLCGMMYVVGNLIGNGKYEHVLLGVDMEGKVWKTIRVPYSPRIGAIGLSQGCLHYSIDSVVPFDDNNESLVSEITLWCLKDRDSKELVLKHTANTNKLMSMTGKKYGVVEIHPDCDTIFLVSSGGDTLVAYDMRHQKVGCILNLEKDSIKKFLPYVPLFQESLADVDEH